MFEIKDFEIHIQYDKEVYKDNIELEQGSVSNVKVFDSPEIDSDFLTIFFIRCIRNGIPHHVL